MLRFKCPTCGKVLESTAASIAPEKVIKCPNCKESAPFKDYKPVILKPKSAEDPKTQLGLKKETAPGRFVDKKTGKSYPVPGEGEFIMGRKPKQGPTCPDIQIETEDRGMSRLHMGVRAVLAKDGRYHVYVFNANNKNESYINGELLADGDEIGLENGDVVKLNESELVYMKTSLFDEESTELTQ